MNKPSDKDMLNTGKALKRAARKALELALQTDTPCYVYEKGKIIDLTRTAAAPPQVKERKASYGKR